MIIRPIRLTTAAAMAFVFLGLGAKVLAYPTSFGPFPPGHEPAAVTLNRCKLDREVTSPADDIDGVVREYHLPAVGQDQQQITLVLRGTTNGWIINLQDAKGQRVMPLSGTNSMLTSQMEVSSSDLNGDGRPDFIVNVWSGGCGLAAEGSEVTFLLSAKDGYRAASFYLYDFGGQDLVRFKAGGPVYFIFNDLIGSGDEKTRDGRDHNFWVYDFYRIDGNRFVLANADHAGFPKWVWFTNKANHEETTQVSQEQKFRLLMKRKITNAHQ